MKTLFVQGTDWSFPVIVTEYDRRNGIRKRDHFEKNIRSNIDIVKNSMYTWKFNSVIY